MGFSPQDCWLIRLAARSAVFYLHFYNQCSNLILGVFLNFVRTAMLNHTFARQEYEVENDDNPTIFNQKKRRIDIFGKVDRQMVLDLVSIIDELKVERDGLVTIVVNTTGGLASQGLAIYDILTRSGLNIRTVILGEVASSGLAIVLAGKKRLIYPNALLHFHATAMEFNKPTSILEQATAIMQREQVRKIDEMYQKIFLANSRLTKRMLRNMELKEACLTAEQALKIGLVHEIIHGQFDL